MNSPINRGLIFETKGSRHRLVLLWTAIMALSGILLFFELGSSQLLRRHEAYVGVSAREMLVSGDWITPRFGGHPRLEKPPLSYWLVAGLGRLQGGIDEWTVRFPGAFSALLLVAFMGFWGTRWYGVRIGLSTAFIVATSSFTIALGRTGVIDLPLILLMTSGLYFFAEFCGQDAADVQQPPGRRSRLFSPLLIFAYCLASLSSLAKPAFGLILVIGTCVAFLLLQRRYREIVYLASPVGIAIAVLLTFAWPYLVSRQVPRVWQVMFTETVAFASGTTHYREPLWFYVGPVLYLLAPWTPLILMAVPNSWRRAWREGDARERFLWVWFLSQFFALSLSVGKSPKYIVPALPPLCLIAAQRLETIATPLSEKSGRAASVKFVACAIALSVGILLSAVIGLSHYWPELAPQWQIIAALLAAGLALAGYFWTIGARWQAVWSTLGASLGCYLIVTAIVVPHFDNMRSSAEFAQKAAALVPPQERLIVYHLDRPPITFYLKGQPAVEEELAAIQTRLSREKSIYILTGKDSMAELKRIAEVSTLFETDPRFKSHVDYQAGLALLRASRPTQKLSQGPVID
jgi:4-amino-4-deoxy-L-arabinose transferase-like glycosyltransferase